MTIEIPYDALESSDLRIDAVYQAQAILGDRQTHYRDPFAPLLRVKGQGGFRWRGSIDTSPYMVIYSDFAQAEWPDRIDETTGIVTYYGDNRRPGRELHETKGNRWLRDAFTAADSGRRGDVVPTLVFTKGATGRDTRFRGLAVPVDLVAIWRSSGGERFQNYVATFQILAEGLISRDWLNELCNGSNASLSTVPESWQAWQTNGEVRPLRADPTTQLRSREQQLPDDRRHMAVLEAIHAHFASTSFYRFEEFAKWLVERLDKNVRSVDLTRPWRDGGRDGVGLYQIGPPSSGVRVEFAMEAKCYAPGSNSVGVREMSRLISRLRHRQFGILVTTSYVHKQAYEEVTEDGHPVVIVAGSDVIDLLPNELRETKAITAWLSEKYS